jgi:hypothetical protein
MVMRVVNSNLMTPFGEQLRQVTGALLKTSVGIGYSPGSGNRDLHSGSEKSKAELCITDFLSQHGQNRTPFASPRLHLCNALRRFR